MSFEQQQQQQGGGKGGVVVRDEASCVVQASSGDSGSTLKAHDYIGLSEVTSMPLKAEKNDNKALPDLNLGETELRLGPPKSPPAAAAAAVAGSGAGQGASVKDASKNQVVADAPSQQQQKWHEKLASGGNGNAVSNMYAQKQNSQEQHNGDKNHEKNDQQQAQQQQQHDMNAYSHAVAAAMAVKNNNINNNNNNTVAGAKRGFSEAIGNGFVEGRSVMPSIGASGASAASQNGKNLMPSMYPWSASKQLPVAWRMGLEQSKGSFGPFPSSSQPMQQQQNKDAGASRENTQNAWDSSSAHASKTSNGGFGLSSSSTQKKKEEDTSDEVAPSPSPPVVGWPPVQSFRKNTLAAHPPPPQKSSGSTEAKTSAPVAPSSTSAAPTASNTPLFVKVYMDGVPIGRKVDLKAHNSYEKLSSVLEEMFHRFITGQNGAEVSSLRDPSMSSESKKLNFLHGSEFVLTYEDKDGDLMLVGDVPWGMFTGTVKRLRIMKGSEAIGLAPPQPAADKKVACQG